MSCPFPRWESRGSGRLSNLLQFTPLVSDEAQLCHWDFNFLEVFFHWLFIPSYIYLHWALLNPRLWANAGMDVMSPPPLEDLVSYSGISLLALPPMWTRRSSRAGTMPSSSLYPLQKLDGSDCVTNTCSAAAYHLLVKFTQAQTLLTMNCRTRKGRSRILSIFVSPKHLANITQSLLFSVL